MPKISLNAMMKAKKAARKVIKKARGTGTHKAYRCRCKCLVKGAAVNCWVVWKSGVIKVHETARVKKVSNTGQVSFEWVVGKVYYEIDAQQHPTSVMNIQEKVMMHSLKVSNSRGAVYFTFSDCTMQNRFLKAIQPIVTAIGLWSDMMPRVICCCCGVKGASYVPITLDKIYLPAPFIIASKLICTACFAENAETGRRELTANAVDVKRPVGMGVCHSEMKMWCDALASSTVLPRGENRESFKREVVARCRDNGVALPAVRVNLFEIGKKKKGARGKGVDGRLEDQFEWRKRKEAGFVVEKFVVADLEKRE